MSVFNFECDYTEGAHPRILERLIATNLEQTSGYGNDPYCTAAHEKIKTACALPNADVHFLVGGTQTNATVLSAMLRPYQGAISADEGHIAVHETGAIEATGHKVLTLPCTDGKITAAQVDAYVKAHYADDTSEHTVQPGAVYLTFPTECGTIYTRKELVDLRRVCDKWHLPIYLDGARLGYGLADPRCDITLSALAALCDVFYIGGTKCGAYFGEAVVIRNDAYKKDFRYFIKRHGGMFAKGRLLGIQFDTLFSDGLYFDICRKAVTEALRIRAAFTARGVAFFGSSMTNQQFPILTAPQHAYFIKEGYLPEYWGTTADGKKILRFCTSWATEKDAVDRLICSIAKMPQD